MLAAALLICICPPLLEEARVADTLRDGASQDFASPMHPISCADIHAPAGDVQQVSKAATDRGGWAQPARAHHVFGLVCGRSCLAGQKPGVVLRGGGGGLGRCGVQVRQARERAAAEVGGRWVGSCRAASSRRLRQFGGLLGGPIRQLWRLWDICNTSSRHRSFASFKQRTTTSAALCPVHMVRPCSSTLSTP